MTSLNTIGLFCSHLILSLVQAFRSWGGCEEMRAEKKLLFTLYSFASFFYFVFVVYFFKYACTVHTGVLASLTKKFSFLHKET